MVTSTLECLTPKGHFGIDCLSPPWLRSWQRLALGECWEWGVERSTSPRRDCPLTLIGANWKPFPHHNHPSSQPLNHSGSYHHCLFTLNYCFSPRDQTPSQMLPVCASASAPAQLLGHAITCIQWGNLAKTHSLFFFFHQALLRSNYICELNSTLDEMCVINVWKIYHALLITVIFQRYSLRFTTYSRSRCPADILAEILLPRCSLQSARWYFITAND